MSPGRADQNVLLGIMSDPVAPFWNLLISFSDLSHLYPQLEEERQEAIDQENRILLAKLTKVIRSAGQLDNWNEDYDELPKR